MGIGWIQVMETFAKRRLDQAGRRRFCDLKGDIQPGAPSRIAGLEKEEAFGGQIVGSTNESRSQWRVEGLARSPNDVCEGCRVECRRQKKEQLGDSRENGWADQNGHGRRRAPSSLDGVS